MTLDAGGAVSLGPRRVAPLSLLAARFPVVEAALRAMLAETPPSAHAGRFVLRPLGGGANLPASLDANDRALIAAVGDAPRPLAEIAPRASTLRAVERLVRAGMLQLAGFTPSDAAHVLRRQGQWRRQAALLGALLLARPRMMADLHDNEETPALAVAEQVAEAMTRQAARVLIGALADGAPAAGSAFVEAAARGRDVGHLAVRIAPRLPLVGVGGPAPVFFPALAARLGCTLALPEHGDAANAIGAALGLVHARAVVEVTSPGPGLWRVHDGGAPANFDAPDMALEHARTRARTIAADMLKQLGGADMANIDVSLERSDIPGLPGDQGLVAALIVAESLAAPDVAARAKEAVP